MPAIRSYVAAMIVVAACTPPDEPSYGEATSEISVGGAVTSSCSTATVRGLSLQIAREVDCMTTNSLVPFSASTRIKFASSAVLPYLHGNAKADLVKAANQASLVVNSGYRTVAQQYLLYRWDQLGRCGIAIAAAPGKSNHESGRAIDLGNWSSRVGVMGSHHFAHSVPGDPVHFDHTKSPDNRGQDVRAFQRLWNRNHPGDKIGVDGVYGPQTAARLKLAPATGFAKGPLCKSLAVDSPVLAIDGPDLVAPGTRSKYVITLGNTEDIEWAASTRIVVVGDSPSDLYDAETWTSPMEVGTLGLPIPAGGKGDVGFEIAVPAMTEATPLATMFALVDATGATRAQFTLSLTVTPDGDDGTSTDATEDEGDNGTYDEDGVETGGCSTGSSTGWGALTFVLLAVMRRRRRS